jgi:hypothetical protein
MERTLVRFGSAVRDWGEHEFESVRPVAAPAARRHSIGWRFAAAAAAIVLAVGVPTWRQHRAAEIARQDEALLQQVQADISRSVPLPMETLASLEKVN